MVHAIRNVPAGMTTEPRGVVRGRVKRRGDAGGNVVLDLSSNDKVVQTFMMLGTIACNAPPLKFGGLDPFVASTSGSRSSRRKQPKTGSKKVR